MHPVKPDPAAAAKARELGNAAYKKGKWADSIGHYAQASRLDPTDPAPLLNRAQAYLKLEKWQDTIRDCSTVLALPGQGKNVKALFRRSLGRKEVGELEGALKDLEAVLTIEPANIAAKEELQALHKLIKPTPKTNGSSTSTKTKPLPDPLPLIRPTGTSSSSSPSTLPPAPPTLPPSGISDPVSIKKSTSTASGKEKLKGKVGPKAGSSVSVKPRVVRRDQGDVSGNGNGEEEVWPPEGMFEVPVKVVESTSGGSGSRAVTEPVQQASGSSAYAVLPSISSASPEQVDKADSDIEMINPDSPPPEPSTSSTNTAPSQPQSSRSNSSKRGGDIAPPVSGVDLLDRLMLGRKGGKLGLGEEGWEGRWGLMTSLPPQTISRYLDTIIEPDHLAVICSTLLTLTQNNPSEEERIQVTELMKALKGMRRAKMVGLMLSGEERRWGREVGEWCGL